LNFREKCCIIRNENEKKIIIKYDLVGRKYSMFEVSDKVVYGVVGVCEIVEVNTPPIKDINGTYYFLQPVYDNKGLIYSPVNSNKVLMRSIMTKEDGQNLIDRAKNCVKDSALNEKVVPFQYDEMIKSQDALQLMHLIRVLYNVKNERAKDLRKMKSADSRILLTARKLLYGEIAISMERDFAEVSDELDSYLGK
jgi:CarD family transcriptional regulator